MIHQLKKLLIFFLILINEKVDLMNFITTIIFSAKCQHKRNDI